MLEQVLKNAHLERHFRSRIFGERFREPLLQLADREHHRIHRLRLLRGRSLRRRFLRRRFLHRCGARCVGRGAAPVSVLRYRGLLCRLSRLSRLRWPRRPGVLCVPGCAFLFSLFRQLFFQCRELFKAHDAIYDEENAWIVAARPESDMCTLDASPCRVPEFRLPRAACRGFFITSSGYALKHAW